MKVVEKKYDYAKDFPRFISSLKPQHIFIFDMLYQFKYNVKFSRIQRSFKYLSLWANL